jgi:hypothetical protein
MQDAEIAPSEEKPKEERKLSREQRRYQDRVNEDAGRVYEILARKFFQFFIENDPESDAVAQKAKEVVAKWRMYCGKNRLTEKAFTLMQAHCDLVIQQYKEAKNVEA